MKPHQKKPVINWQPHWQIRLKNQLYMQKQSENAYTNHIIVDEKFEPAKEKCEIRSLKEAKMSVRNTGTRFVTNN